MLHSQAKKNWKKKKEAVLGINSFTLKALNKVGIPTADDASENEGNPLHIPPVDNIRLNVNWAKSSDLPSS